MQFRYAIFLTMDELRSLPMAVKQALADIDPEFANVAGVAPTGSQQPLPATIPAQTNQPNQATAFDPVAAAAGGGGGIPGIPQSVAPQVPSAMPNASGIPGIPGVPPQAPAGVNPPMQQIPGLPQQPQQPQQAPQAAPAPQQAPQAQPQQQQAPAPAPAPQQAPAPQAAAPQGVTAEFMQKHVFPLALAQHQSKVMDVMAEAVSQGYMPQSHIASLTDQQAPHVLALLNQRLGTTYGPQG